ncbi:hypothetical protein SSX86_017913 [Deinandra increscens subsp. villosa]|uniref:Uncharacterized protein n=1 Tax=Deinandra increscens subsp. villosa TaxID=3103831 RepID=A0AAP0CXR3_9ASTR
MAEKEAPMVHKPENESSNHPNNPFSSIISKFTEVISFRFPPPPAKNDARKVESERKAVGNTVVRSGEVVEESKPVVVRFPDAHPTTVEPLKLQAEEMERDTNPVFLWQVYAIGGFFVLRWVLARWKERRASKKSSDEDSPPSPPPAAAAEGNE